MNNETLVGPSEGLFGQPGRHATGEPEIGLGSSQNPRATRSQPDIKSSRSSNPVATTNPCRATRSLAEYRVLVSPVGRFPGWFPRLDVRLPSLSGDAKLETSFRPSPYPLLQGTRLP